jgi:hypothetical protein
MTSPWTRAGGLTPISEILCTGEFRRFAPATVKIAHVLRILATETKQEIPERFGPVLGHCESTPEALFLWHFCQRLNAAARPDGTVAAVGLVVAPQFIWQRYRLDFLIATPQLALCVEIDGLRYHKPDSADIEADYRRQRDIVAGLCPVMRFLAIDAGKHPDRCWADIDAYFTRGRP